jgi:hypothetical protein
MDIKKITLYVTFGLIPLLVAIILGYDVYAIAKGGTEASISSLIITASYKMPFMVYIIGLFNGILVGHLFWRMKSNNDTKDIDNANHNP